MSPWTNDVLWTAADARKATGGKESRPFAATGVSIDSRTVSQNDLFVALVGPRVDGHDYVAAALSKGAAAAVVARVPTGVAPDAPLLSVADTQAGLEGLGRFARARTQARIVAVTGSVGKTGTKESLRLVLAAQGATHASEGSLNNQWGVPLSLARMPAGAAYGVFEIGMNHPGEITPLVRMVRPHVAVVTAVEPAHIEFFPSIEAIADAKAEIFLGVERGGAAVLPADNPLCERLVAAAKAAGIRNVLGFGAAAGAFARLKSCDLDSDGTRVNADIGGRIVSYRLNVPGRHWVSNSLAVLAAASALGADVDAAAASLARVEAPKGRGRRHAVAFVGGAFTVVDESYNASPASMAAAIAALGQARPKSAGRRVAVLGDMLELGEEGPMRHAALADLLEFAGVDLVFACGKAMTHLWDALPRARRGGYATDSERLAAIVAVAVKDGDIVMVKGSAGSRMGRVVEALLAIGVDARISRAVNGD